MLQPRWYLQGETAKLKLSEMFLKVGEPTRSKGMKPGIRRVPSLKSWLHLVANESRFLDQSFPRKGASQKSACFRIEQGACTNDVFV